MAIDAKRVSATNGNATVALYILRRPIYETIQLYEQNELVIDVSFNINFRSKSVIDVRSNK